MDVLLVTITLASLLVTGAMSLIAWKLSRDERERSAARVAALAAEIDDGGRTLAPTVESWSESAFVSERASPEATTETHGGLFAGTQPDRPALARFAPAILAGVVILGGVVGTLFMSNMDGTAAAAGADTRPLELLSLRHSVKDGTLTVTGLVRNPPANRELERLNAVVFLFDDKGGFLASGRAPADFAAIAPGEESPFVVNLNAPSGVARYRVSFRRDEAGVMPHIDRRNTRMP